MTTASQGSTLIDAVLASGASLPSPGIAFLALHRAANDDDAGVADYARAVAGDPALCGAIMRVANSAVFRPPRKSEKVEQAIAMIGYAKTLAVAASVSLRSGLDGLPADRRAAITLTLEDVGRAADFTYLVAKSSGNRHLADVAYLAAVMQDAGFVLMMKRRDDLTMFDHHAGDGHESLGESLMRNWKMPPCVVSAVAAHHNAREAERLGNDSMVVCCLLAAGRRVRDGGTDEWFSSWSHLVQEVLGVTESELDALRIEE